MRKKSNGSITSHGYKTVYVGKHHHLADGNGRAYEHRMIAEQKLGRRLQKGEIVHHINGNKLDNHPKNLEITQDSAHHLFHHRSRDKGLRLPGEENPLVECACGCGETFYKYDSTGRLRKFVSGHNMRNMGAGWLNQ